MIQSDERERENRIFFVKKYRYLTISLLFFLDTVVLVFLNKVEFSFESHYLLFEPL